LSTFRIGYIKYTYQVKDIYNYHIKIVLFNIRYEAGDHVAVFPSNDEVLVNRIGELLNADLDEVISLINVDGKFEILCLKKTKLIIF
jgi:sulfite reductase alpha subunit-like flavoprotein